MSDHMKLLFIIFLAFSDVAHGAAVMCPTEMRNLFLAFEKAWSTDGVYYQNNCCSNVTRLYHEIKESNPQVKSKDFDVVLIVHPKVVTEGITDPKLYFSTLNRRGQGPGSSLNPWAYHVVLAYNGFIFDLDHSNTPTVSLVGDYLEQQFKPPQIRKLAAYIIPGSTYFKYPAGTRELSDFRLSIPDEYAPTPLSWLPTILKPK